MRALTASSLLARRPAVAVTALTLGVLGLLVFAPEPAQALPLNPPPTVEQVLQAIVDQLFKVKPAGLSGDFLRWLIAVPNFIGDPATATVGADLKTLAGATRAVAFGVLAAVATWAVVHYWLAGTSFLRGSGGDMLEGITRSVGVALLIMEWPFLFGNGVAIANSMSAALVDGAKLDQLATMLSTAMGSDQLFQTGVSMIVGIVISIATVVMVLGLAITKIVMSVGLAVLFVWMPIAFVIWPLPSLSFITRASFRITVSLIVVQVIWAVCLATFVAIGSQVITWGSSGSVFNDAIARPFVALGLLSTMMMVTRLVLHLNVSGGGGGGMSGGGISHLAAPITGMGSAGARAPAGATGSGPGLTPPVGGPAAAPAPGQPPTLGSVGGQTAGQRSTAGGGANSGGGLSPAPAGTGAPSHAAAPGSTAGGSGGAGPHPPVPGPGHPPGAGTPGGAPGSAPSAAPPGPRAPTPPGVASAPSAPSAPGSAPAPGATPSSPGPGLVHGGMAAPNEQPAAPAGGGSPGTSSAASQAPGGALPAVNQMSLAPAGSSPTTASGAGASGPPAGGQPAEPASSGAGSPVAGKPAVTGSAAQHGQPQPGAAGGAGQSGPAGATGANGGTPPSPGSQPQMSGNPPRPATPPAGAPAPGADDLANVDYSGILDAQTQSPGGGGS